MGNRTSDTRAFSKDERVYVNLPRNLRWSGALGIVAKGLAFAATPSPMPELLPSSHLVSQI